MRALAVVAGDAHPELAREIAALSGAELIPAGVSAFADGETRVRIDADIRGRDLYIVQPTSTPPSERLVTLALIADAARGGSAARVSAVIPYFGYARQDVCYGPGEPRSARVAARILGGAGIERVVALELHSPALESAFEMPITHLRADEPVLAAIRSWQIRDLAIVSPDAGGLKRAQRYAAALSAPLAAIVKIRPRSDVAVPLQVLGEVRDRACVIVDDLASTGRTIEGAARTLRDAGAREVHALFIHGVMAPGALERIGAAGVRRIVTTDSVRPTRDPRVETVPVAGLFADALAALGGGAISGGR